MHPGAAERLTLNGDTPIDHPRDGGSQYVTIKSMPSSLAFLPSSLSKETKTKILAFGGTVTPKVISCIQEILDDPPAVSSMQERLALRRLLLKLSIESSLLPHCVFIEGIECPDSKNPIHGGSFADIFYGSLGGQAVALKRLRVVRRSQTQSVQAFCREALIWRGLKHPNILTFFGVDQVTFAPFLCMVSPLMRNGNMMEFMCHLTEKGEEVPFDFWIVDVARGLEYLHHESLVHGDLRGANILIDDDSRAILSDFGLSRFANTSSASSGSLIGGAARWMAPEIMRGSRTTSASDIYSFGCVCLELLTRKPPFAEVATEAQVVHRVLGGGRPQKPSIVFHSQTCLWRLMKYCWIENPNERPDAAFLVQFVEKKDFTLRPNFEGTVYSSKSDFSLPVMNLCAIFFTLLGMAFSAQMVHSCLLATEGASSTLTRNQSGVGIWDPQGFYHMEAKPIPLKNIKHLTNQTSSEDQINYTEKLDVDLFLMGRLQAHNVHVRKLWESFVRKNKTKLIIV